MHPVLIQFTPPQLAVFLAVVLAVFGAGRFVAKRRLTNIAEDAPERERWLKILDFSTFFAPVAGIGLAILLLVIGPGRWIGLTRPEHLAYPLKIHTYGLMVATGCMLGLYYASWIGRKQGLDGDKILNVAFWIFLSGFAGAHILFGITQMGEYESLGEGLKRIFFFWRGGFVWYGGLISAFIVALIMMKREGIPHWQGADCYAPGVILGLAFGRIGCFNAGCCYGKACATDAWYGVTYPPHLAELGSAAAKHTHGVPVYPAQLFESAFSFALFAFLVWLTYRKTFHGQIAATMLIVYSIWRPIIERFRGDSERKFLVEDVISTSQFIGVLTLAAGIALYFYLKKTQPRVDAKALFNPPEPEPEPKGPPPGKKKKNKKKARAH